MTPDRVAVIVLASGLGTRFGAGDKLLASLDGKPVAHYAAACAMGINFAHHMAVVSKDAVASQAAPVSTGEGARKALFKTAGFTLIENARPEAGQGVTIACGIKAIEALDIDGALILLADMPFVPQSLLRLLCEQIDDADAAISLASGIRQPPVLFHKSLFAQLRQLSGDAGARPILRKLENIRDVPADPAWLRDIDTPEDLGR